METIRETESPQLVTSAQCADVPADLLWQLTDGKLEVELTAAGAGGMTFDGLAVTRFNGDRLRQNNGVFAYLRDLEHQHAWSVGWQPAGGPPAAYRAERTDDGVRFVRRDHDVESTQEVFLRDEVEYRRCTIRNLGATPRRIEITSYCEWVLQDAAADDAHPAFSKLFVETSIDRDNDAVFAHRRRRSPEQRLASGAHWIAAVRGDLIGRAEFETCRGSFLGRGGSLRRPAALLSTGNLIGRSGPVLDPIAACRQGFFIPANESAIITFATAARSDADQLASFVAASRADARGLATGPSALAAAAMNGGAVAPPWRRVDAAHSFTRDRSEEFSSAAATPDPFFDDVQVDDAACGELEFFNGLGGFAADGKQYVIRLSPGDDGRLALPPMPWSNIVANDQAGFIATETGAGYTWAGNSRENRLTPWRNDPILDPPGEAIYLRDRDRRRYWSTTPGPAGPLVEHEVCHEFGATAYRHHGEGLRHDTTVFMPPGEPIKLTRTSVRNTGAATRNLDLFAMVEWALGNGTRQATEGIRAWFDETSHAIMATNSHRAAHHRVAFFALAAKGASEDEGRLQFSCDLVEFLGPCGDLATPAAVSQPRDLSGAQSESGPQCAALQREVTLRPGEAFEFAVLLGEADSVEDARELVDRYRQDGAVDAALTQARDSWRDRLGALQIETPSRELDLLVNGWLPYQNLSCRIWARSAYYQAGGAFGFRDQLQDAAAYVYHWPQITREAILRHASHQFVEGDVLHWWHPPHSRGLRTRFADDLLWLPLCAAEYCATTGDANLWDESAAYLTGPQLDDGEDERFIDSAPAGVVGSIYEHCCRAIDRSLAVGPHGLPVMGCGDWNDGMNRIGRDGGESVWMGFFLVQVLNRFLPVCRQRGDDARVACYQQHRTALRNALNDAGWDGRWYRRAFFADGPPVGAAESAECQIDALAQAWALLSGVAPPERAEQCLAEVESRLVDSQHGLIKLLTPAFDRSTPDPGYIQGYVPGVRENGGQYTHGVLWFIRALAERGRGSRAVELLEMLTPIRHGNSPQQVAQYLAEPYVVAADVYGEPPHQGRAGWTWYTGSAGWMFRVAVESILGFTIEDGRTLVLRPSISADWPRCQIKYRAGSRGTTYNVVIENPLARESGVTRASLDDEVVDVVGGAARIPLANDGRTHDVRVVL